MRLEPGSATSSPFNVRYRIDRVARYVNGGDWLDFGSAEGGYAAALLRAGATRVVGVDVDPARIETAKREHPEVTFQVVSDATGLPFDDCSFDGVFMNEVFEHVADEGQTLRELHRVLRPGGHLVLISPNRQFPFEGHAVHIGGWTSKRPTPLIPWLPRALTDRWVTARNYWPGELRHKIECSGFLIVESGYVMPVFERYRWLPDEMAERFRRHITSIDRLPLVRRLGVSNLTVARRQG